VNSIYRNVLDFCKNVGKGTFFQLAYVVIYTVTFSTKSGKLFMNFGRSITRQRHFKGLHVNYKNANL